MHPEDEDTGEWPTPIRFSDLTPYPSEPAYADEVQGDDEPDEQVSIVWPLLVCTVMCIVVVWLARQLVEAR